MHPPQQRLGHREGQRCLAAGAAQGDAATEDLDGAGVLDHDCDVVTGGPCVPWLGEESPLPCVESGP